MIDSGIVEIRIDCDEWRALAERETLAQRCYAAVAAELSNLKTPVCVLFTGDEAVRKLNARFRGKDRPTNVLSFPSSDQRSPDQDYLGDIALAFETCAREAGAVGVSLADHTAHLLVHAMLHLLGFDHELDPDAEAMEAMETRILERLGVQNPYREETD